MNETRPAAVAGSFYTEDANELKDELQGFLSSAKPTRFANLKAIISPHAGYIYSGAIAASAFKALAAATPSPERIKRIVILGPAHRVGFRGMAGSSFKFWQTPLGKIEIDHAGFDLIRDLKHVGVYDEAHKLEHSLEVQVPFIQTLFPNAKILPLVVGAVTPAQIAETLERLWDSATTLFVISSDLSHYLPYDQAVAFDFKTSKAIESLDEEKIDFDEACGALPIRGLLTLAKTKNLKIQNVDLRNSGDTAGDKDRVVGYGAFVLG